MMIKVNEEPLNIFFLKVETPKGVIGILYLLRRTLHYMAHTVHVNVKKGRPEDLTPWNTLI